MRLLANTFKHPVVFSVSDLMHCITCHKTDHFCFFACGQDLLETVYEDGVLVKEYTFAQVRENAEIPLVKEAKKNGPK